MLKNNSLKSLLILTTAISSLMMVSCSSDDDNDDGVSNTIQPPEGFDSVWVRDCQATNIENEPFFQSFRDFVTIEGLISERTRVNYSDVDCQLMSVSTTNNVTVEFSESGVDAASGLMTYPVEMTVTEFRVTPETQELTDTYNEANLCGVSNFTISEATVVPIDCDVFGGFGDGVVYGLWAIDGDLLYFGSESITVNERPTAILFEQPFRRQ